MKICPHCKRIYNNNDFYCLNDHYRLDTYTDEQAANDQLARCNQRQVQANQPTCPTCHSTNVVKISDVKRAVHGIAWGFLSKTAFSQFECKNCGYKWQEGDMGESTIFNALLNYELYIEAYDIKILQPDYVSIFLSPFMPEGQAV